MGVAVLCFVQAGCMGCGEQSPINRGVEKDLGVEIQEIDIVKDPRFVSRYRLRVTPTTLVVVDGEVKERFEGLVYREELEAALKKYLP